MTTPPSDRPAPAGALQPRAGVLLVGPSQHRYPETFWSAPPGTAVMHLNEAPWPPSPAVIAALQRCAHEVWHYPDSKPAALLQALAERTGVPAHRIHLGSGSDDLLQVVATCFLGAGDTAVMPAPAFPKYRQACLVAGAEPIAVGLAADGAVDVDAMLSAVRETTRVLFVPTPNNPTGNWLTEDALRRLIAATPRRCLLLVDEAYHEFARHAGAPDLLPLLAASDARWIALRTFSKAHGLAGLRIGYALAGDDQLAEWLERVRPVFAVAHLGIVAALAALSDPAYLTALLDFTAAERRRLAAELARRGMTVLPSATNFLAVDLGRDAQPVTEALRARGIVIGRIAGAGYERFVRITIGTAEQNDALLHALTDIIHPTGAASISTT